MSSAGIGRVASGGMLTLDAVVSPALVDDAGGSPPPGNEVLVSSVVPVTEALVLTVLVVG